MGKGYVLLSFTCHLPRTPCDVFVGSNAISSQHKSFLSLITPVAFSRSLWIWFLFLEEGWPELSSGALNTSLQEVLITLRSFVFSFFPIWWFSFPCFIPINYSSSDPQFIPSYCYWYLRQGICAVFEPGLRLSLISAQSVSLVVLVFSFSLMTKDLFAIKWEEATFLSRKYYGPFI